MRILFTGVPTAGHLFPLHALMDAAAADGHDVAVLTGPGGSEFTGPYPVLTAGPSVEEAMAETGRRLGFNDGRDASGAAELFGGVRPDLGADQALQLAAGFGPDLVVAEAVDQLGPLVATAQDVPYAVHGITGPLPPALTTAITARTQDHYDRRGLHRAARVAFVDPFPTVLLDDGETPPTDRLPIRTRPHQDPTVPKPALLDTLPTGRPVVVLSLGTVVTDEELLQELAENLAALETDLVVTAARGVRPPAARTHLHPVGFVPLEQLLPIASVVVSAGGSGTVLASLAHGVPLVVRPVLADQPWNAERLSRHGVAVTVDEQTSVADAVRRVLSTPSYTTRAREVADAIHTTPDAADVLQTLLRLTAP
jgi:UDP:flavonoid glycosyltransferase YjiC (YdhE family)